MPPDFLPTHHRSLRLQNFTAFGDATFDFVPGVNVLVGENGTGKTHVLKALNHFSIWISGEDSSLLGAERMFSVRFPDGMVQLIKLGEVEGALWWDTHVAQGNLQLREDFKDIHAGHDRGAIDAVYPRSVFLPAVDMIGHTKGYLALERSYELDFDRTYGDIVSLLELQTKHADDLAAAEMATLQDRMGGTVEYDASDRRFYLVTPQGRIAMPLVAEGLRKFATLHTIWKNGWLRPGTCLFWDEPEANLNPNLMDEAVAAILALARGGVQVFLATHSYVILKELEVQATPNDAIRFFALEKTGDGTVVHPADRLEDLSPNPILAQYERLYNLDLERTIRGSRR